MPGNAPQPELAASLATAAGALVDAAARLGFPALVAVLLLTSFEPRIDALESSNQKIEGRMMVLSDACYVQSTRNQNRP